MRRNETRKKIALTPTGSASGAIIAPSLTGLVAAIALVVESGAIDLKRKKIGILELVVDDAALDVN